MKTIKEGYQFVNSFITGHKKRIGKEYAKEIISDSEMEQESNEDQMTDPSAHEKDSDFIMTESEQEEK